MTAGRFAGTWLLAVPLSVLATAVIAEPVDRISAEAGQPRVRIEYAPAADAVDAKAMAAVRPVHKTVLVDGTEVTHLEGRGMESLRLVSDGDGVRMVCGAQVLAERKRRVDLPADFRSGAINARKDNHDAR